MMFRKKEILCSNSMGTFNAARDILNINKIAYTYKIVDQSSPDAFPSSRGRIGTMGMNVSYLKLFYLYVAPKDLAQAKYVINK